MRASNDRGRTERATASPREPWTPHEIGAADDHISQRLRRDSRYEQVSPQFRAGWTDWTNLATSSRSGMGGATYGGFTSSKTPCSRGQPNRNDWGGSDRRRSGRCSRAVERRHEAEPFAFDPLAVLGGREAGTPPLGRRHPQGAQTDPEVGAGVSVVQGRKLHRVLVAVVFRRLGDDAAFARALAGAPRLPSGALPYHRRPPLACLRVRRPAIPLFVRPNRCSTAEPRGGRAERPVARSER